MSSGPSRGIQTGRTNWPSVGIVHGRLPGDLIDARQLGRGVGGPFAEALVARPLRGQHTAETVVPGGLIRDDLLMRLLEGRQVLGQDVMHGLVSRSDQPKVRVPIEHPDQEVGVAGLPDREESDVSLIGGIEGLSLGGDRAQARRGTHHDLRACNRGKDGVSAERLGHVGDRQLRAGQFPRDQVGQVVAAAVLAGSRCRSCPAGTRRRGSAASPAWPTWPNRPVAGSPARILSDGLRRDRFGHDEELGGYLVGSGGRGLRHRRSAD